MKKTLQRYSTPSWGRLVAVILFALAILPVCVGAQDRDSSQEGAQMSGASAAPSGNSEQSPAPPPVSGSGTANYVPLWTNSTTLGNSKLYQTGGKVGIGTTSPAFNLDVKGRINSSLAFNIAGSTVVATPNGTGNIALGYDTLISLSSGQSNVAVGYTALMSDTSGKNNTACGADALRYNTISSNNSAVGYSALFENINGEYNEANGSYALENNVSGSNNTADGSGALAENVSGSNNVAVGLDAAINAPTDASNNIHLGSQGTSTDYSVIRIGEMGAQSSCFVAGIRSVITGNNDAIPVMIDSNGQLGTVSSSRRYKEDIQDMGDASSGLMRLRPVRFRYQKPFADGSKPLQYGLIAEEVEEVYPDLVASSADGQVETVKYQLLDPMLLNELQRQNKQIESQRGQILSQQKEIDLLASQIKRIQASLEAGR